MMDRKELMVWYIWETCDKKKRITLQNMGGLMKYDLLPEENENQVMARRIYEFNRYLKAICKTTRNNGLYQLDERAINFLVEIGEDNNIQLDEENLKRIVDENALKVGVLFDKIDKKDLFGYVSRNGALPRKTFSMGEGVEKRYYLEGRMIKIG